MIIVVLATTMAVVRQATTTGTLLTTLIRLLLRPQKIPNATNTRSAMITIATTTPLVIPVEPVRKVTEM